MPNEVSCSCEKVFHRKEEHAGNRAKCPNCGCALEIPSQPPAAEDIDYLKKDPLIERSDSRETQWSRKTATHG